MPAPVRNGLTVAITGATGDIGVPLLRTLERSDEVARVLAMARSPFDPPQEGLAKVAYRQGDVLDRAAVEQFVAGVDVVVHLAFMKVGSPADTRAVNLDGSRNVFEAAVAAGVTRLVHASSVAAYGFHAGNPSPLTEDVPARGSEEHYYSIQKAEQEQLLDQLLADSSTTAYVMRPCTVAGPDARPLLFESLTFTQLSGRLPDAVTRLLEGVPILRPVLPDPGIPFQLIHHDDVASALCAAIVGRGAPGAYNLAGPGELRMSTVADELGWYSIPVPELAVDAAAELVARVPGLPAQAYWIAAFREPVLMDCAKARRELGWLPKHDGIGALREMISSARLDRLMR
jgi:nucleoside-diphosphate-sugar epimerase